MEGEKYSQTRKERKRENGGRKIQLDNEHTEKERMAREKYSQTTKEIKIENGERKIQFDNERKKKRKW